MKEQIGRPKKKITLHEVNRRKRIAKLCVFLALFFLVAAVGIFFPYRRWLPAYQFSPRTAGELRVHFLAVGQADCSIVEFPDGEVLVIDGGDGTWKARNHLFRFLKGLAPTELSLLVTRASIDHYGGFEEILNNFPVQTLYLPALAGNEDEYWAMVAAADENGCKTERVSRYDVFDHPSGAYLCCISPYSREETEEDEASTVLFFQYQEVKILFGSDIPSKRERKLYSEYLLDEHIFDSGAFPVRLSEIDVLRVSRNGSSAASHDEWIQLLKAECAIVSCGRGNSYQMPHSSTMQTLKASGAEIYRTDELGDITVAIKGGTYSVTHTQRSEL